MLDNNNKFVAKIASECDKAVNDVKDLTIFTDESLKSINLSIEQINQDLSSKLNQSALKEF